MPPAEKHILEIDSAELAFGERRILSGVYLLVETGGVTAVLGRNGCGKSCLMKILSGSLKAGILLDAHRREMARAVHRKGGPLPSASIAFIPGWLRLERALRDFGLSQGGPGTDGFRSSSPCADTRIGELSGGEQRISGMFHHPAQPGPQFILLDEPFSQIAPLHVADAPNTHPAGKNGHERDFAHRPHVPPRDRHCRPAVRNGRRAGLSVRKRRRPGPAGLSEPSLNGHSRR